MKRGDSLNSQAADMVTLEAIQEVCDKIAREFHPQKIILFGSYAYGTPREDSDVDLMVVTPFEGKPVYKAIEIHSAVRPRFAMDLLARTPDTIQQRLEWHDFFIMDIIEKGKILYEADHC
jgi:predicted nucleotidyltransferase